MIRSVETRLTLNQAALLLEREAHRLTQEALAEAERRVAELERRAGLNNGRYLPCGGCGGPHRYDTSVPSVLWNKVVRARGFSDYLCATCILEVFAKAGEGVSFHAQLYGAGFAGTHVEVRINGKESEAVARLQDENNRLRVALRHVYQLAEGAMKAACEP